MLLFSTNQDMNTTRYHVVTAERLLKTDLQPGGYKQTMLGFSYQLSIFPRDGKVPLTTVAKCSIILSIMINNIFVL